VDERAERPLVFVDYEMRRDEILERYSGTRISVGIVAITPDN